MGGIGKTFLAKKIAEQIKDKQIKDKFNYLIWRSLRETPPVEKILEDLIKFLSDQQETNLPETVGEKITLLIDYLNSSRCLLILDNVESIMQSGEFTGQYREGYTDYRKLINAIGEQAHNSCLLLTSREKPQNLERLARETQLRFQELEGLTFEDGQQIFTSISISGSEQELKEVFNLYSGNPLFLDLAAKYITDMFGGNISEFLKQAKLIIGQPLRDSEDEREAIRTMLDWYFQRLSKEQKEIMYWLAINREAVSISQLKEDLLSEESKDKIQAETLPSLQRRIPLETSQDNKYTLQNVLVEYMTDRLVKKVYKEIKNEKIKLLKSHALLKAQALSYVRETQKRLILKPIVDRFNDSDIYIEDRLDEILKNLPRPLRKPKPSYTAGNILNLLCYLKIDLTGYDFDFSHLAVWQAYLQGANLNNVNFSHSNLDKSVFTQIFGGILSVALSPSPSSDKQHFATGHTGNGEVCLWQLTNNQILKTSTYPGKNGWVWAVAFSHDGSRLASVSEDKTIKIWDVSTKKCRKLEKHNNTVWAVAFNHDGSLLASVSEDKRIIIWDVRTEKLKNDLGSNNFIPISVAFNHNGSMLAVGSDDKKIRIWDNVHTDTEQSPRILEGHTEAVCTVAFNHDGSMLASGSHDKNVKLWNVSTKECETLEGHTEAVWKVSFNHDDSRLVSSSGDKTVKLWNVQTRKCHKTLTGHNDSVRSAVFSLDGSKVISSTINQNLRLWDTDTGNCLGSLLGYPNSNFVQSIAFNSKNSMIAAGSDDQAIHLWNNITGEHEHIKALKGHEGTVWAVAFSPDGSILASGSADETVKLWNVDTGECLNTLNDHNGHISSVAFSPCGSILASGSMDRTVKLWDVDTGKCLNTFPFRYSRFNNVPIIWLLLRDINTMAGILFLRELLSQDDPNSIVCSVAFNPHGSILAIGGGGKKNLKLWHFKTNQPETILNDDGHTDIVESVAFSPCGSMLASGSRDKTVKLWKVDTGECLKTLKDDGHTDKVKSIAFSPNGSILVSCSEDKTVKFWDVNTRECLKILEEEFTNWVESIAFSPDGSVLSGGSCDGEVGIIRLWDVGLSQTQVNLTKMSG
jgi:WD40 repeat protein